MWGHSSTDARDLKGLKLVDEANNLQKQMLLVDSSFQPRSKIGQCEKGQVLTGNT